MKVKVTQSCPTLCNPMDYTIHGIFQARILEWVPFPFSRGSSQPRNRTGVFFTNWAIRVKTKLCVKSSLSPCSPCSQRCQECLPLPFPLLSVHSLFKYSVFTCLSSLLFSWFAASVLLYPLSLWVGHQPRAKVLNLLFCCQEGWGAGRTGQPQACPLPLWGSHGALCWNRCTKLATSLLVIGSI